MFQTALGLLHHMSLIWNMDGPAVHRQGQITYKNIKAKISSGLHEIYIFLYGKFIIDVL